MGAEFICDICGERKAGFNNYRGDWLKPSKWYQRTITEDEKKVTQVVCSRKCLEEIGGLVAPW